MPETKKPRICEVLEVEPFQQFVVSGYGEKYFIDYDGDFCAADRACDYGELVFALAEAINHPESIKRKPRWTQADIEDARAIKRLFPGIETIHRGGYNCSGLYIHDSCHYHINDDCFQALKEGESVSIDEILEAEHGD